MSANGTGILGLGAYVPERVMTNQDWAEYVETSDEWIVSRTGIRTRRFAADDQTTVDLAEAAAKIAMEEAGIGADEIDEIIVATDTPEVFAPDSAAYLQDRLGARNIIAYDLAGSGCAGFVLGLDLAQSRSQGGERKVLLVGVELISRIMNWEDRATCVLFGDAAGAAVVGGGATVRILAVTAGTDGSKAGILGREVGGTRRPFHPDRVDDGSYKEVTMNGREVFKEAVHRMSQASREVLEETGLGIEDVALVVPHQANMRILKAVGKHMQIPDEKLYINVDKYGNTGSASVPLALYQARREGRVKPGDKVLLTAFGAGFHWAAAMLEF